MKLADLIKSKIDEIGQENNFRSVSFSRLTLCKISKHIRTEDYLAKASEVNNDTEVEEIERNSLEDTEIDVIELVFNAVKPRCSKPIKKTVYVKEISSN